MAQFKPYKILSTQLASLPIVEGQLILTTDTNELYFDKDNSNRIKLYNNYYTKEQMADVATTGSYNSLLNKPIIPSFTSQLTNNSDYQTSTQVIKAIDDAFLTKEIVQYEFLDALPSTEKSDPTIDSNWTASGNVEGIGIAYGNGKFIVLGNDGMVYTLEDDSSAWASGDYVGYGRGISYAKDQFIVNLDMDMNNCFLKDGEMFWENFYNSMMMMEVFDSSYNANTDSILFIGKWGSYEICGSNLRESYSVNSGTISTGGECFDATCGHNGWIIAGTSGYIGYIDNDYYSDSICIDNNYRNFYGVAYGLNKYVVVGEYGTTYYSTDGREWLPGTGLDINTQYNKVAFGNDMFVAVGNTGKNYYSLDGINWIAMTPMLNTNCIDVAFGNNKFIFITQEGTSYFVNSTGAAGFTGKTGVIYFVLNDSSALNVYDEYIWVNNSLEKIGGAKTPEMIVSKTQPEMNPGDCWFVVEEI